MKKHLFPTLVFMLFLFTGIAQQKSPLELTDIFNLEYVSEPQISPDGSQVVYIRNFKDIMTDRNLSNLWIVNTDGSENRPLTTGNHNVGAPRWSHDGTKIAYLSNAEDDKMKLYTMWLNTRQAAALTNTPQSPGSPVWSPDDRHLAFTMFVPEKNASPIQLPSKPEGANWNEPPKYIDALRYRGDGAGYLKSGNRQIFVLSTDGGTPRQLTTASQNHSTPSWSSDGRALYFSANLREDADYNPANSEVHRLELGSGEIATLTDRNGPDSGPIVAPNGKHIAYVGYDDRYQGYQISRLYVMDPDGSNPRKVSGDFDRSIGNVQWSGDSNALYFQYDDNGDTKVGKLNVSSGKIETVLDGLGGLSLGRPYNAGDFSVASDGSMAYTLGNTGLPADLAVKTRKEARRITQLNADLFDFRALGEMEELRWKSSFDQREMQGWIVKPPNFDPE